MNWENIYHCGLDFIQGKSQVHTKSMQRGHDLWQPLVSVMCLCPLTPYYYTRVLAAPALCRMLTAHSHFKAVVLAIASAGCDLPLHISMATSQMSSSQ